MARYLIFTKQFSINHCWLMQSERVAAIFVLAIATCQSHAPYSEVYEQGYRLTPLHPKNENYAWSIYAWHHEWLFDEAGVDKMIVTAINTRSFDFTITASLRGQQRVKDYYAFGHRKTNALLTEMTSIKFDLSDRNPSTSPGTKDDGNHKNLVCISQRVFHADDECRRCLMQRSESYLGDFFVTIQLTEIINYIMYTSHPKNDIVETCHATGVCNSVMYNNRHLDDACQLVHGAQVSRYSATITTDTEHGALSIRSDPGELRCYKVTIKPEQQGKSDHFHSWQFWLPKYLLESPNENVVYWMKMSGDVSDFTILLVRYPNNGFLSTADKTDEKLNVEEVDLKTCYGHYGPKLDDSALRDRRSLYTPDTASASSHYSNCVLAYHKDKDSRPCRKCIRDKFSTPLSASAISFLFTIQSTKAENLETCITTRGKPVCYKFVYLQDDVCAHEISLTKKPSMWKKLPFWKAKKRPAYHLSLTERPSSQSEELAPVVLVETPTPVCLACYALIHNVLFVSTEKNYIWMERTRGPRDCDCGVVQKKQFSYRIGSLRAVSFRELKWHLYGWRKLSGDNGERINAFALPMVTRVEDHDQVQ